ncbi:hypothetical protein KIPB_008404 [Kipferlia bialata]|uniref:Uncharacterized protein n=1 Tax=Kipferlia bialata TaxID=797122 RepID=A0A9K3GKS3_9EUKA|nr:hypothetical protein KIPB_008404 [Kipferlia bialata]|eukprot:g8404.t1
MAKAGASPRSSPATRLKRRHAARPVVKRERPSSKLFPPVNTVTINKKGKGKGRHSHKVTLVKEEPGVEGVGTDTERADQTDAIYPLTLAGMKKALRDERSKTLDQFHKGMTVTVNDRMQTGYSYTLDCEPGESFADDFQPFYTPAEMLSLGVFEGKYLNDCIYEFPREWYVDSMAKHRLSPSRPNPMCNQYGPATSRQGLSVWRENGWVYGDDVRGWFQWYCRYWMGRRDPAVDQKQIKRYRAIARHEGQVTKRCEEGDRECRPRQRQCLLQWAHDTHCTLE